jgi:signal recognition particle receptor subunit beta
MVLINKAINEVTVKLVYYGPGLCGKTTNLEKIYGNPKLENKGKMISMATETDRTLFFDFMPMELGTIAGQKVRVQLYTVPGQVFYDATRKLVLRGADGVVFVADSQPSMRTSNLDSLENLRTNLRINRIDPDKVALVFQYNKRDLPSVSTVEEMSAYLNPGGAPFVEASAVQGLGVTATLRAAVARILDNLKSNVDTTLYDQPELTAPDMKARSGVTSSSAGTPKLSMRSDAAPPMRGGMTAPSFGPQAAAAMAAFAPAAASSAAEADVEAQVEAAVDAVAPAEQTRIASPLENASPFELSFDPTYEPAFETEEDDPFGSALAAPAAPAAIENPFAVQPAELHDAEAEQGEAERGELATLLAGARAVVQSLETALERAREHERILAEKLART